MYKSILNMRNFKRGLKQIEKIAGQKNIRDIDFACGYAVAMFEGMKKSGKITRVQKKALEDLAYETADDTAEDIQRECGGYYSTLNTLIEWDIKPPALSREEVEE